VSTNRRVIREPQPFAASLLDAFTCFVVHFTTDSFKYDFMRKRDEYLLSRVRCRLKSYENTLLRRMSLVMNQLIIIARVAIRLRHVKFSRRCVKRQERKKHRIHFTHNTLTIKLDRVCWTSSFRFITFNKNRYLSINVLHDCVHPYGYTYAFHSLELFVVNSLVTVFYFSYSNV